MANSMTEHSRKLRSKTANEYNKRMLAEGKVKQFSVRMETPVADEFVAILAEIGGKKAEAIKKLCEIYRQHQA
ncbi:hypothetical protein Q7267_11145 [Glaesserella parasuis]|uniref:Uncharacterized protein n=6 Tax=Glaesserella parasuis TaxID=738 RepID=B8F4L9_GLAP5|nr:hypothetical protein [Glaesserella parasuis]AGO16075.1 hypothetical protein K756_04310 [Glaesserella parasuis ZJ0906]ATW45344.1 hypothetical protein A2U21_05060 [Glaesserella parasuis str. Nagasaki]ACL32271.1 conserved hypothetical protein [Glaesserella parasuis SH0165]AIK16984.1 hypothetical protein JL26_03750 [Glaesserella parasuis]EPZ98561.1 hypothetical protein HPSNAG_2340 [Glaesserella parasuis str. Nagasaki]